ncbi:MAG: universal stress protein [Lacipirellulaceae bacterium]
MSTIKNILIPVDFSKCSQDATIYAEEIAERFDAAIHLLHVIEPIIVAPMIGESLPTTYLDQQESSVQEQLNRWMTAEHSVSRSSGRAIRHGSPFVEIIRYARENQIDLIVMGTHGLTGLKHALIGSVAEKVVRKASCPVLTVREAEHEFEMP